MSREKVADALQVILNLSSCHMPSGANAEIIKQSEIIAKAASELPEEPLEEPRVNCHWIGMAGHTVLASKARDYYSPYDKHCISCERCQRDI